MMRRILASFLMAMMPLLLIGCTTAQRSIPHDHPASAHAAEAPYAPPPNVLAAGPSHHAEPAPTSAPSGVYTCPHHPEVKQDTPGICPKCKMKLRQLPAPGSNAAPGSSPAPAEHKHGDHR